MSMISLKVSVPVCSLRKPYAREFLETETVPPPSTVYGFLLSLVGEESRRKYIGTRLAIAVFDRPAVSQVLRTSWRTKSREAGPGIGNNKIPNYQEVLTGLIFGVQLKLEDPLAERIKGIFAIDANGSRFTQLKRFGGLSFGESRDLVDTVEYMPTNETACLWLKRNPEGSLPLPLWADHVGSKGTHWEQCELHAGGWNDQLLEGYWLTIQPPENL